MTEGFLWRILGVVTTKTNMESDMSTEGLLLEAQFDCNLPRSRSLLHVRDGPEVSSGGGNVGDTSGFRRCRFSRGNRTNLRFDDCRRHAHGRQNLR